MEKMNSFNDYMNGAVHRLTSQQTNYHRQMLEKEAVNEVSTATPKVNTDSLEIYGVSSFREQGVFNITLDDVDHRVVWNVGRKGIEVRSDLNKEQLSRMFALLLEKGKSA